MRRELLDVKAVPNENKRRRKVVPHCVTEEIEALKLVPFGISYVPGKRSARLPELSHLPTSVARLYPDAVRRIDSSRTSLAVGLHDGPRTVGVDRYRRLEMLREALHFEQLT